MAWLTRRYYLPGTVEAAVTAFQAIPQAAMIYRDYAGVMNMIRLSIRSNIASCLLKEFALLSNIGQPAVFIRTSAFREAGGLDTFLFHFLLDHQLWIKLAEKVR